MAQPGNSLSLFLRVPLARFNSLYDFWLRDLFLTARIMALLWQMPRGGPLLLEISLTNPLI
jgi:hypothetical protein